MTSSTPVPADVDAESIIDLVADCREISGVLGDWAPTVITLPEAGSVVPVDIDALTAAGLDDYEDYGS